MRTAAPDGWSSSRAQRGIGKTRLAAELAAELHRDRAIVLYASGAGAPETARAAVASARAARRPTLLVLDDLDRAGEELRGPLEDLAERLQTLPVLVVAATGPGTPVVRAGATLTLAPLDADGVAAIARSYAGPHEDAEVPIARLVEASGGVPQLIHRCASEWARNEAAKRLDAAAGRAASERARLRAAEDDLAGTVVERQAARERDDDERGADGVVVCPFKGLASFDLDDSRVLLRPRAARRGDGRPAGGRPADGHRRTVGEREVLRTARRAAAGARRGRAAGQRGLDARCSNVPANTRRARSKRRSPPPDQTRGSSSRSISSRRSSPPATTRPSASRSSTRSWPRTRDPRRRALVLVAVRADFYGRCATYPELWRLLGANQVTVGPMRRDELRRAIELPATRAGLQVEPELTDALIADVEGEPGALPLMSTALLELWQRRDGRRLRLTAYEQAGGVDGAVARLAESTYGRLDPAQREIARRILLRLAGEGRRRRGRAPAGGLRRAAGRRRRRGARRAHRRPTGHGQ